MTVAPTAASRARLEVQVVAGQSTVTSVRATNPLKLLTPRSRGPSVWTYLTSYGGGLLAGDETSLDVRLGRAAKCFLTTQSLTKIYRNPRLRPCSHRLSAVLEPASLLVAAPEPVQAFAGSLYSQHQEFQMDSTAGLVLLDWFCAGRSARGERWGFTRLESRNELFVNGERVLLDALLLEGPQETLRNPHRLGRFNCLALIVLAGDLVAAHAAQLMAEIGELPVEKKSRLLVSASPLRHGALLRVAGEHLEQVAQEVRRLLRFVPDLLYDDPWIRKW